MCLSISSFLCNIIIIMNRVSEENRQGASATNAIQRPMQVKETRESDRCRGALGKRAVQNTWLSIDSCRWPDASSLSWTGISAGHNRREKVSDVSSRTQFPIERPLISRTHVPEHASRRVQVDSNIIIVSLSFFGGNRFDALSSFV